jgi:hypothetical protein
MPCRSRLCRGKRRGSTGRQERLRGSVLLRPDGGCLIQGCTTAIEDGTPRTVGYAIHLDSAGATRSARINGRSAAGPCSTVLEADGAGHWLVDGETAPQLDSCLDVDLESSAMTNALPVRRLGLAVAAQAATPAAYVRSVGLAVDRLEQTYLRTPARAHTSVTTTPLPPLTSSVAWPMTSPAWCSTIPRSLSGPSDRPT